MSVEAALEHPFFVFDRGWSSCTPAKTDLRFGLQCHQLNIGDRCISLTQKRVDESRVRSSTPLHEPSTSGPSPPPDDGRGASPSKHDSDGGDIDVTAVSGDTPTGDLGSLGDTSTHSQARTGSADAEESHRRADEPSASYVSVDSPSAPCTQRTDADT